MNIDIFCPYCGTIFGTRSNMVRYSYGCYKKPFELNEKLNNQSGHNNCIINALIIPNYYGKSKIGYKCEIKNSIYRHCKK